MTYLKFTLQMALVLAAAHGDVAALSGRADHNPVVTSVTSVASDAIPKPGGPALILVGLIGVGAIARRRLSSQA